MLLLLLNAYTPQVGDEPIDQFISDQWALAVGREASIISDLSSAVAKQFRSFHRMLTVSQVGLTPMFVLQVLCRTFPLQDWASVSMLARLFLFVVIKAPEDTTFLEIALLRLWCSHLVVGTWPRRRCLPSSSSARRCIAGLCCEFYPDLSVVCALSHDKMIRSITRSGTALPTSLFAQAKGGAKGNLA